MLYVNKQWLLKRTARALLLGLAFLITLLAQPIPTYAVRPPVGGGSGSGSGSGGTSKSSSSQCSIGVETTCPQNQKMCTIGGGTPRLCTDPAASGGANACLANATLASCNIIQDYVQPAINFLSALVGVAVVISIIIGGIQYGSSAGDSSKVSAAKNRIRNAIIALVAFLLLYSILNFLIPGGLV